jgi:hypothetical protein
MAATGRSAPPINTAKKITIPIPIMIRTFSVEFIGPGSSLA